MPRLERRYVFLALLGVMSAGAAVWAQPTTTVLPASAVPADPLLKRRGEIMLLINQAKEELLFNHPAAAKQKCEEVLTRDPDNIDARFILAQAERQLRTEPAAAGRPTISSLPDAAGMKAAVERSRPTTSVVVLPSDRMGRTTGLAGTPAVRSAVADPNEGIAPRPTPFWLSQKYLIGASVVLLGVIGFVFVMMIAERFTSGKRHRVAQARLFDQMQNQTQTPGGFEVPEGHSRLDGEDDFPIGVSVSAAPAAAPKPAPTTVAKPTAPRPAPAAAPKPAARVGPAPKPVPAASTGDEEEVDLWGEAPKRKAAPSVGAGIQPRGPTMPEGGDEEVIPAGKAFSEEWEAPAAPGGAAPPRRAAAVSPATAKPAGPILPVSGGSAADSMEEEEGPISLEGILAQSSGIPDYRESEEEEKASGPSPELRPDSASLEDMDIKPGSPQARIEEVPFALDSSFDQTLLDEEEDGQVSKPVLPSAQEASEPEAVGTIRLDDDFPLGDGSPMVVDTRPRPAPSPMPRPSPGRFPAVPPPPREPQEDAFEEILFSPTEPPMPDAAMPPGAEKTIVDGQARPKAVFQDQLARGMAAMDRGDWKEAVQCFSVAQAMDPTSDFARERLREAREKKG